MGLEPSEVGLEPVEVGLTPSEVVLVLAPSEVGEAAEREHDRPRWGRAEVPQEGREAVVWEGRTVEA